MTYLRIIVVSFSFLEEVTSLAGINTLEKVTEPDESPGITLLFSSAFLCIHNSQNLHHQQTGIDIDYL